MCAHLAGNVFARKAYRVDSSSEHSPGTHFDSPQLPWWNGGSDGTEPVSNAAQRALSASDEGIEGTAKIAELQLYHNEDGQPALLGRGGFGQVRPMPSNMMFHEVCSCGTCALSLLWW
jgi:hypothetical protein